MVPSLSVLTEVTGFDCNTFKKKFLNKVNPVNTNTEDTDIKVSVLSGCPLSGIWLHKGQRRQNPYFLS